MVTTGCSLFQSTGLANGALGSISQQAQHSQHLRNAANLQLPRRSELRSCGVRAAAAPSVGTGREKDRGKRRSKEPREERAPRSDVLEEDIYTIEDGWSVHIDPAEEMIEIAGVQVPVRLKQQLQNERRSNARNRASDKAAAPVAAPRLTHKLLRVMAGSVAGKKLTSCADLKVRPMMEVVRGAVFNILHSLSGWSASTPSGRWLDLYSGTGSVAIEALSRGCCEEAHFVEMDPWVITNVLQPNLQETNFDMHSTIHTSKVESLLQQAADRGADYLGGGFDFVSVTPPYEAVSYTALMAQLAVSPLITDNTFMVVEYPIKSKHEIPDTCGKLYKVRDRRYGRTFVAIYGPEWVERD
ncbi:16S rRNA (guanine966-N2)-methyltransferase [Marchantia polymorpha subsp. ruderalis]|uniref:Uncharacterized protein n=2 Tax=Marchantia polymorpha TaxID=3197 RepID=A0AAF6B232_MARPO|nr:hypothetical protein MARPO_0140s0031 [Marchantia polymorpha]BBN06066.1 hypothetical protein Mp_3g18100 [Marchantia polymorpha subsp. ruderalis]|eukprot:PTQ29501.1 hypothetical protein MARPO_0140s0031 [Marchantia polymorpha]